MVMRWLAATQLLLACAAWAGEPPILERSRFLPQTNIIDQQTGRRIGIIRPNPFIPGRADVYSEPENTRREFIEPSPFLPQQWNIYRDAD